MGENVIKSSDKLGPLGKGNAGQDKGENDTDNAKEPSKTLFVTARYLDVHAKKTSNQIQRDEDSRNDGNLAERFVDLVAG